MTVKLEKDMLESVDNHCEGLGCSRTDFVIEAVQEKLEGKTEESEINVKDIEPITEDKLRIFDCNSGIMYENGIVVGNCSEIDLRQGKVFDKNGKQIGITRGLKSILELKNPTVEII